MLGLQPEVHTAMSSMEQPEFSAMLMKMTGDPQASFGGAHEHNNVTQALSGPSNDIEVMPELAFDFSLPFDDGDISFDPSYSETDMRAWCHNAQSAGSITQNR